ncbi:MAG: T9SS type A sorting domain-containing protein [Flavobacteriales bacterium]|nr:T9SS type A sorting domain-containing protein [Flavobacteriales bacterium]MBK7555698.1 T9SS type A sorting domain-containing protein [Flavobacteriales bacterium]
MPWWGAFMEDEDEFGNNTLYEAGSVYYLTNDTALMDNSTGLDLTHITTDLLVFPVPTSDVLNVVLPDTRTYRADVIGLDGRLVLPLGTMRSRTPVDVSTLTAGAYLLRLTSGAYDVRHIRFVKE